jgi:hypothetical protein
MKYQDKGAVRFDPYTGNPVTPTGQYGYYSAEAWRTETASDMHGAPWAFDPYTGSARPQLAVQNDPYCRWLGDQGYEAESKANTEKFRALKITPERHKELYPTPPAVNPAPTQTEAMLSERASRYGSFDSFSILSQGLKSAVWNHAGWENLPDAGKEALEMTLHKIARIVNGDCTYQDSWDDAVGYLTRGLESACRRPE